MPGRSRWFVVLTTLLLLVGAVAAAGVAAIGGFELHDSNGSGGISRRTTSDDSLPNYFSAIDFPADQPRISVAVGDGPDVGKTARVNSPKDVVLLEILPEDSGVSLCSFL